MIGTGRLGIHLKWIGRTLWPREVMASEKVPPKGALWESGMPQGFGEKQQR
jgi:hypothetical protein